MISQVAYTRDQVFGNCFIRGNRFYFKNDGSEIVSYDLLSSFSETLFIGHNLSIAYYGSESFFITSVKDFDNVTRFVQKFSDSKSTAIDFIPLGSINSGLISYWKEDELYYFGAINNKLKVKWRKELKREFKISLCNDVIYVLNSNVKDTIWTLNPKTGENVLRYSLPNIKNSDSNQADQNEHGFINVLDSKNDWICFLLEGAEIGYCKTNYPIPSIIKIKINDYTQSGATVIRGDKIYSFTGRFLHLIDMLEASCDSILLSALGFSDECWLEKSHTFIGNQVIAASNKHIYIYDIEKSFVTYRFSLNKLAGYSGSVLEIQLEDRYLIVRDTKFKVWIIEIEPGIIVATAMANKKF